MEEVDRAGATRGFPGRPDRDSEESPRGGFVTGVEGNRNLAAGVLLVGAVGVSAVAARSLERLEHLPKTPAIFYFAFALTVLLSLFAGRLGRTPPDTPPIVHHFSRLRTRLASLALGYAAFLLFLWSWLLRPPSERPLKIVAVWAISLALGAAAFAVVHAKGSGRRGRGVVWRSWLPLLLGLFVLLGAAVPRLIALDRIPPTFGGDEASQVHDGLDLIRGELPTDPFGTGWTSSMHLGMLPAGWGATLGRGPIAGPRLPYAIAGTVSVVGSATAAGIISGGWGALACAALLVFSPHHVHFSRLASHMILDSLFAVLTATFLLAVYRSGKPLWGYLAGLAAGLSLYGYSGGRPTALIFLMALPVVVFLSPASRRARGLLALALATGFLLAAAPNLRFAVQHFSDWNGRVNQVGIFAADWWRPRVSELGSPRRVIEDQVLEGTLGLLSEHTSWPWYRGYPIVAPVLLPSLALTGFGWMVGRRRVFAATLLASIAAANLADVILTQAAPAPQRASSLMPVLAIVGGIAVAGFLSLVPSRDSHGIPWRGMVGGLLIGGLLMSAYGLPGFWDPSPGYGGAQAGFITSAYGLLASPRYRDTSIYLHGPPYVSSSFPTFEYLLPQIRWVDVATSTRGPALPQAGFHLFSPDWLPSVPEWRKRFDIPFGVAIADRGDPLRDVGYLLFVPRQRSVAPAGR